MDIRERIKKMASGEIDINEYTSNYQKKLKQEQEEKRRQQRQQKNSERVQNVIKKGTETANSFQSRLPVAQKFYEQRQKETEVRQQKAQATNNNNVQLPVKQSSINTSQNVQLPISNKRSINKANLPTFTGVASNDVKTKKAHNNLLESVPKMFGNLGYGMGNGLISFQQTVNREIQKQQERDKELFDSINKKVGAPTVDEMNKKTFGDKKKEPLIDLEKQKQINNQKIQGNIETSSKGVGKKLSRIAPAVGEILDGILLGGLGPLYFAGSAKGNYYDEAIQRGMSEEQADRYSGVMALLEAGGETVGANLTKAVGKNIAKGGFKQAGKTFALDVAENVAEEAVMEPLSELTATTVAGKEYANWDDIGKRMLESGIDGGLVGMIMGGASAGIGSSVNIVNKVKNKQNITVNELQKAKDDINSKISNKQVQQKLQEAQDIINNAQNKPVNAQVQQITGQQNKMAQNGMSAQLNDILNDKELPMQGYQYENSDNVKINNLRQDANRYFNNSEKAKNYVNMLEKIITDKDIEIRLDSNLKTADGRIVNGSYSNGIITINPNSTRTGEFIAIHELTHAIGTKEMLNMVNAYRQSNAEFDNAVKGLLQNYQSTEITEEALADISGQLFGNQEFINSIAQKNPNIFQKIYSEIKYLWHQFRGYKNQNQFVEDLYYKWTQAYSSSNKLNTNNNYAIETNDKGYKYVRADRQVISGNNPEVWKEQTQNYIDEKIRNNKDIKVYAQDGTELTITKNTSGKATFRNEVRQADGTIRKLTDEEFASKLRAETHIDELGQVSTHKNGPVADTKNHNFAKDGFTYRNAYFEDVDGQYYKITMSVGKNGDINTIYNVGKMQQAQKNRSNSTNRGFKDPNGNKTASSRISSINSIPSQNKDVNTTKYSIQESENNSGSFFMSENKVFDVKGNENLNNASTLFFRTKDDGTYYVQATNGAGNITYDGTFINKRDLERTLGTEIAEYIVTRSEHTNNEIYLTNNKVENETDYMMSHRPSQDYGDGSNFESNMDGVFEHPEWYINMREEYNLESLNALRKVRNKPDALIIIYRATPGNKINVGDWVTPSKKYAKLHNNSQLDGKGNILELKVRAKDILWGGDDINEFGYFPNEEKYSLPTKEWQQYLDKNYKSTGTRTNLQDIKLPTREYFENKKKEEINLKNITNIKEPKIAELPSNDREKVKQNKVAKILSEPVKNQKPAQRTWAILQANLIDKGAVFETLSLKTRNRELQGKYDATLSSGAKGQYAIGNDRYTFENGNKTLQAKSLTSIIEEVGENETDFYNYMYHQLNIDRMTLEERFNGDTGTNYETKKAIKNKPVFGEEVTAEYSKQKVAEYEEKYPEFKSYAQDVYDFLDANKHELVNNGVISQELSDKFKEMYPHYVPIARIDKSNNSIQVPLDTNRTGINNPIKKATGGSKDIQPMFHTIADRTLQTYRASARNAFGVELKNTLEKNNLLSSINEDIDVDTIFNTMADEQQTGLTEGTKYKNPTFTVFENGKKVTYDINQDMYDALKPQNELITKLNNTKASKVINTISNVRRGLLTEYNPLFSITNSIKDAQDVLQNSQHAIQTYKKFPEAYAQIVEKGYWYNEYMQNGGEQNSYFKDGEFKLEANLPKGKKIITLPFRAISKANSVVEMAPRLAEYIASRENGSSIETSMLDAARVTTNFKAGGDITKFANRNGVTFLNAGVQGMAQQIRNIREANARGVKGYAVLVAKTILAGTPALILNNLIWGDDEDYDELQDYVKDSYYIVGKIGEHQFIRVPKGRTTAVIQKLFSTANKYITKEREINIDNFAEDFWANLVFTKDNIAPNNPIDNNIFSPLVQVSQNKTWYGDDLVPTRLQDVPVAEQYDESTDEFSKWLGKTLNISPIKINYLLDQYGGGVSDVLLPLGTPQAENNPIEDKFTTNSVMKSKYPGEFFEKSDELKVKSNSEKATDEDKLKYKYFSSVSEETSELYKKKREIQNSKLTDTEKEKQIIEVQKQINSLTKDALETVEEINIKDNTAVIGEYQYYKATNLKDETQEWKKLSTEEMKKNKNISLKTYADYKEKVAKETIKQRKAGTIKQDASLKDKDKIQILLGSNYMNEERKAIYENYIKNANDTEYTVMKTTGINIMQYLRYKQQEFTSEKKDDGTLTGKTVSKSKQKKVVEYLNSMNIAGNQRLLLYSMQGYTTTASQKKQLANYVNGLNLNKQDKLKLFDKFSGFTVYKNGRVTW